VQPVGAYNPASIAETVVFIVLSAAVIAGALFTITRRNPVTAVMSLVATFFALAGIYATLNAHFLTVLQVAVYAGAIMVLFIFVVMILNREEVSPVSFRGIFTRLVGVVGAGYVAYVGASAVWRLRTLPALAGPAVEPPPGYGSVSGVGLSLFRDFVFPFEAISVLLLVAIVGGIIVSRSSRQEEQAEATHRRREAIAERVGPEVKLLPGGGAAEPDSGHQSHGHH
jgi:NADH-quinone oxidoreductase subunit J